MTMNTNVQTFTLTSEKNGSGAESLVLRKNGNICSCPFRNPTILPHPNISGQAIVQNPICSDGCQFFEMDAIEGIVFLSCTPHSFKILIEKEKKSDHSRPQDSKIILP